MPLLEWPHEPHLRTFVCYDRFSHRGELPATAIYEHFPVSPQAVSQHLKVLREAHLVQMEKQAQKRLYRLNPEALSQFEVWVQHMQQLWSERFDALDQIKYSNEKKRRELNNNAS